ncbi:hypothetical protein EDB80DRAFT_842547 [Ilyonectria destructans]|nr:hypothetical protein EDB80DRAFT_842547 [Ilyonectria destructans]
MRPSIRFVLVSLALGADLVRCAINLDGSQAPDQHDCPPPCVDYANIHSWIPYLSVQRLSRCKAPMLLQLSVSQPLDVEDSTILIRSCTLGSHSTAAKIIDETPVDNPKKEDTLVQDGSLNVAPACIISGTPVSTKLSIGKGDPGNGNKEHIASLLGGIKNFFSTKDNCDEKFVFAYYQQTVASVYIGPGLGKPTVKSALDALGEHISAGGSASNQTVAELCGNGRKPQQVFGAVIDTTGDLAAGAVQAAGQFLDVRVFDLAAEDADLVDAHTTPSTPSPTPAPTSAPRGLAVRLLGPWKRSELEKRAVCKYAQVEDGDSCTTLSVRNVCATLKAGDYVCCSAGDPYKPAAPEPNADGTCKSHLIENGDSCDALAKKHGVTVKDIEKWNAKTTWVWTNCKSILVGYNMCVGAECGPLVPGTKPPKDNSTSLADLNPCPLKACCSNWGFCGVFPDHRKINAPLDGAPGTRNPGFQNTYFGRISYYETFDIERNCLQIGKPVIKQGKDQWADFKKLKEKRILSIGGWADSTEPGKFNIIRSAILQNRKTFANNLAQFAKDEGIDGIDIDWEYPGAPDILVDGKPIGEKSDGLNYLQFLTVLKDKMPSGKTVSIAAPASYWYLKQFPIDRIAEVIDYIIFMTYDLHGQWDYSNTNAYDECPSGKCIRSHGEHHRKTRIKPL